MKKGSDGYYRHTWTYEGKRYSVRAKTERDLWRKVRDKEEALKNGMVITNENTPVKKWFADYLEIYKKSAVTTKTYKQLEGMVKNYINPNIGERRIKDIRSIDLQRIINSCAGMSTSLTKQLMGLIRSAFRRARIERIILFDPAEELVMPETVEGTHRSITDHEREHILKVCETHRAGLWVLLMLYTGARPVETRLMKWEDVDFKKHEIIIHSAKTDFGDRRVPVAPALYERLVKEHGEGYVLTQPKTGGPHSKMSMFCMWNSFKKALDVSMGAQLYRQTIVPETSVVADDLTPYCMRHTFATDLQTAGVPINVAKDLLGHKTIAMTARIYTHLSDEAFQSASQKIADLDAARRQKKVASLPR